MISLSALVTVVAVVAVVAVVGIRCSVAIGDLIGR